MGFINTVLGTPLGFIIYFAYRILDSYGLAILVFAVIVRIPLFPVMLLAHKNSIRLLQLQPALNVIKQRHARDKDDLSEAQYELFKKEKYSPLVGIVPLFAQLFLVIGMLQVMYHPLQHVLRLDPAVIDSLVQVLQGIYSTEGGFAQQLLVLEAFQCPENRAIFYSVLAGLHDGEKIYHLILGTDMHFLGLNLVTRPSVLNPSPELIVVLLSGIGALLFCLVQNAISPGALSQNNRTNLGLTIFTVGLSLYFAYALPVGVGLYWTVSNFAAIGVALLLELLYSPKKLAAETLAHLRLTRKTPGQLQEEKRQNKALRVREKKDVIRFRTTKKGLVFYAISAGQYKYYKNIVEYLLDNSNVEIHYLTNDPNDATFRQKNERIIPYYASQRKTISLMLKLDAGIMVTTVEDLQSYHMKRSIAHDDIEYIHIIHGPASLHLVSREKAYDHYDTIFCVGPHQVAEIRRREEMANLPRKKLVATGYGVYDQLVESYAGISHISNEKPRVLIAPSWQADNILDLCIDEMLESLLGKGYSIVVRPHPQYIDMFPERIKLLTERYSRYAVDGEITFGLDFFDNQSIYLSDVLITDWSNIAFEFSYSTLKPSIFINTPMKIINRNYEQYGLEALDISLRDKVGISVDVGNIKTLDKTVALLISNKSDYRDKIEQVVKQYLYHPCKNGEAGGKYIINQLQSRAGVINGET